MIAMGILFVIILAIHNAHLGPVERNRTLQDPRLKAPIRRSASSSNNVRAYCNTILSQPRPFPWKEKSALAIENKFDPTVDLKDDPTFVSQYGQDWFLYANHYSIVDSGRPNPNRVYFDLATNDAMAISNTWVFDACLGWSGLCVEPQPRYVSNIFMRRSCEILSTCVGSQTGEHMQFTMAGGFGGVAATNKNNPHFQSHGRANIADVPMICLKFSDITERRSTTHIDVLSLDVEGHEIHVLHGIDWDNTEIDFIIAERGDNKVDKYLVSKGYFNIWEEIWMRPGMTLGSETYTGKKISSSSKILITDPNEAPQRIFSMRLDRK